MFGNEMEHLLEEEATTLIEVTAATQGQQSNVTPIAASKDLLVLCPGAFAADLRHFPLSL